MGAPLLDGFERGFNMMERHNARIGRDKRLSELEQRNESRYQDGQARLADIDKQNDSRYKDTLARQTTNDENTAKYRESMLGANQERTSSVKEHQQWQKNKANEQQQWGLVAPQLQNIHEQYFETGTMPEQAARFFSENPQYADYSPESFRDPEYVKSAQALKAKTTEIFEGGKLHQFKDPEYIELFNGAFKSKIQEGVGDTDTPRNAKVIGKRVAELIPTRDGKVSIGLEVTYEKQDGEKYTEIQPMTQGRTSENEDPVREWDLKELMSAIDVRASMADLAVNGDEYRNKSGKVLGALKPKVSTKEATKLRDNYRRERSSLEKELRKAEQSVAKDMLGDEEKEAFLKPIHDAFTRLDKEYGIEPQYKSTLEGHDVNSVIERFQKANSSMSKEQALAAAIKQGYISE